MECERLRELLLMGDEGPLRAHAGECSSCREWLEREERLLGLLRELRSEAESATEGMAVGFSSRRRMLPVWIGAAAAAAVLLAVGLFLHGNGEPGKAGLVVTKVVISGQVSDNTSPPAYVEVDGKQFPVERVSQDVGRWKAEIEIPAG